MQQPAVEVSEELAFTRATFTRLKDALNSTIVGQEMVIDQLLTAILADGHVLLEGVPGTAKTLLVKTIANLVGADFGRIQLTPDMLPSDIVGTSVYDLNTRTFAMRKGPIFTSLLLADEINRTPPKTQSALLEAMEERQVTLDGHTEKLSDLFLVVATQNPVEFEGTYPLPEAQLDRFMLKVLIGYPGRDAEKLMLQNWQEGKYRRFTEPLQAVTTADEILACRQELLKVKVEDSVMNYLIELVQKSRSVSDLQLGASPRAALAWLGAAKAHAAIEGRDFVTPDNIKFMAEPVLRHRLILNAEAELDGVTVAQVVANILRQVAVPR
ncbi:MAG: MoxR-like ATPase [Cyanobacteriota bacterium erpe_2018_sw_39hr_WHONDRS-SW48-000098_B_bin.30]|jgi:MoxR-like ATPase|nr:MoxR family ATPase [Candidatus Obscuribacter sp.]MBK7839241.1 MoxR family ATPase [Candidatus Obscuribacter sp.]MBK9619269.1 MoxR family ATPase [Candidatus Obscuribacter sp.]MDQ5966491.1 MoxR-like ATPase [Cyanobacteriota bacterium erpe_2018_sw_39hr_WHONDRS-SW48-000098_B_bin.30]